MKTQIVFFLFCILTASAVGQNFFGIELNNNTTDNVINLIYGLAEGRSEVVDEYKERLQKSDPILAKSIILEELKLPCSTCRGGEAECDACAGTKLITDPQSLGYLQYKFETTVENGQSERAAWKQAKAAFDEKRAVCLNAEQLVGTVLRKEGSGLLLQSQNDGEKLIYLKGISAWFNEGAPLCGQAWPIGTHALTQEDGSSIKIPSYTATLWMD